MMDLKIGDVTVSLEKKPIKNMYIRVTRLNGQIKVTAPLFITDDAIKAFVISRMDWIQKQQYKFKNQPKEVEYQYISGETHYLWGNPYYLEVVHNKARNHILLSEQKIILHICKKSTPQQRANIMNQWYREILKKAIPPLLEQCEKKVGVKTKECYIKNMKSRWGTCNIRAQRIWLNLQLIKKSPECLEYVMIHELVHLLEKKHNVIFKAYMDQFCPNWRKIKTQLNTSI